LKILHSTGILKLIVREQKGTVNVNNVSRDQVFLAKFKNKLGFAAGLDKNGDYIDCLAALGVGFIEVGTVTPNPQSGNKKPRLFRNKKEESLLNRLGFNNKGVDHLVKRLKTNKSDVVIGSSIGKNFDTPNDKAFEDYLICLEKVYEFTDYVAVNISSPNTENLRELSNSEYFNDLLSKIKLKQESLSNLFGYKPIFIKVSPDEQSESLKEICNSVLFHKLDGIICSNTSIDHNDANGKGGLSGAPLKKLASDKLSFIKSIVKNEIPLIASGGVMTVNDFEEKINCGADLVQVYTGFIFKGPKLIQDLVNLRI
jgi:dihydroorotate dehydrogenase